DRRRFVRSGGLLATTALGWPLTAAAAADDPHFLIVVHLGPGADASYFVDARPLAMTAAGLIQNYTGKEPTLWQDAARGRAWGADASSLLLGRRDSLSVVNGVHMAGSFAGHPQNVNYLLAGSPFGGELWLARAEAGTGTSLDFLQVGNVGYENIVIPAGIVL